MKLFKDDGFGVDVPYNGYARGGVKPRKRTKANLQAAVNELGVEVIELRRRRDYLLAENSAKLSANRDLRNKLRVLTPGEPGLWQFQNTTGNRTTVSAGKNADGSIAVVVSEEATPRNEALQEMVDARPNAERGQVFHWKTIP